MALSDSSGLYLFSALLQANAAILALLAVFAVFRIQTLANRVSTMREYLLQHGPSYQIPRQRVVEFEWASPAEKERMIGETPDPAIEFGLAQSGATQFRRWRDADIAINETKTSLAAPIVALTSLMVISAFGIIYAVAVHSSWPQGEPYLLFLVALGNSFAYVWVARQLITLARK